MNNDLLYDILMEATAFPEVHQQETWGVLTACGTAYCMAGMANAFEGNKLAFTYPSAHARHEWGAVAEVRGGPLGMGYDVETRAQDLLGFTHDQSMAFFRDHNSIDRLWELASEYTDGEVARPADSVVAEYRLMGSRIKKLDAEYYPESA